MATAKQLIGLLKSHVEGNEERFFDLALQLASSEEQKGHTRLAEQLRQWVEAGQKPKPASTSPTLIAKPRGELGAIIGTAYPETRLNDLILPETVSSELDQLVTEFRKRDMLEKHGLSPRQRVLLAGPPGTGKTMSASALAGELKLPLYSVLLHGLISKFMGETASKLNAIFEAVRTQRGVYLFDEIDALAAARDGDNDVGEARRTLNSFLQFMEEDTGPSLIIATTNLPRILDKAILRRFDLVLMYDLPTADAMQKAMSRRLIGFDLSEVIWDDVVEQAHGLSSSDVIQAAMDAARRAVLDSKTSISSDDLLRSIGRRRDLQALGVNNGGPDSSSLRS
ncbi:AAA family ATPase [Pacificoceanicola onchidii]|uniref:AAA family ATPase n=1 Tax=Pacificoceanicola onchidii TaxID=2562685 RepID=UPI0010A5197C|nr:ATP-binding protein [Pacificoceanicola onchidii]